MNSNTTLDYYNSNALAFAQDTASVDFKETQDKFLAYIPSKVRILDFGCGSGRDTKYFLDKGYEVEATDGSEELCKLASEYTGICVKQMYFEELKEIDQYDGIWACSSILHVSRKGLLTVVGNISRALKVNGYLYTSFKYGSFEGERNGRYFTDMTEELLAEFLLNFPELELVESWITGDVRKGREREPWLNIILQKK